MWARLLLAFGAGRLTRFFARGLLLGCGLSLVGRRGFRSFGRCRGSFLGLFDFRRLGLRFLGGRLRLWLRSGPRRRGGRSRLSGLGARRRGALVEVERRQADLHLGVVDAQDANAYMVTL